MDSDKDLGNMLWSIGMKLLNYQPKMPLDDLMTTAEKEKLRNEWLGIIRKKLKFDYSKSREENLRMLQKIEASIECFVEPINESLL